MSDKPTTEKLTGDQDERLISIEEFITNKGQNDLISAVYTTAMQLMAFAQAAKKKGIKLKFKALIASGGDVVIEEDGRAYCWIDSFEIHLDPNGVIGEVDHG